MRQERKKTDDRIHVQTDIGKRLPLIKVKKEKLVNIFGGTAEFRHSYGILKFVGNPR